MALFKILIAAAVIVNTYAMPANKMPSTDEAALDEMLLMPSTDSGEDYTGEEGEEATVTAKEATAEEEEEATVAAEESKAETYARWAKKCDSLNMWSATSWNRYQCGGKVQCTPCYTVFGGKYKFRTNAFNWGAIGQNPYFREAKDLETCIHFQKNIAGTSCPPRSICHGHNNGIMSGTQCENEANGGTASNNGGTATNKCSPIGCGPTCTNQFSTDVCKTVCCPGQTDAEGNAKCKGFVGGVTFGRCS